MKCPHCLENFHEKLERVYLGDDIDNEWSVYSYLCPGCKRLIFELVNYKSKANPGIPRDIIISVISRHFVRPKGIIRSPLPIEVPKEFAEDYNEACLVIYDSPKASAALSRRCLQKIIREKLGIKKKDLYSEIQEVIDNGMLPTDILQSIDAVRGIGNFAAHPIKSQSSGEIIDVEPHEAEWNLDVLEMIFDYLFVRPTTIQKKKAALNVKLKDSGKPEIK
jgi:hypothetical protein